jgi:anthranilate phosphoribosyltransferase
MIGESAAELAAAAQVLREKMVRLDPSPPGAIDTCGTGGDGHLTFNISTAVAIVVAACRVPVVKHGNRAVSSRSGSADVLSALGIPVEAGTEWSCRCLQRLGLGFCLAPLFHPALKALGPLRRRLGIRTTLNLLGPLANPAHAPFQLLGVGRLSLLDPIAEALALLGTQAACVVCSEEGLDEISLSAPTHFRHVRPEGTTTGVWTHDDFGLPACSLSDLRAEGAAESAAIIRRILLGEEGPSRHVVLANAAVALWIAGRASDIRGGVARAAAAIDSGEALRLLESLRTSS